MQPIMPTVQQENDFIKEVIPSSLLEDAMGWIAATFRPEEIFSEEELNDWAEGHGFIQSGEE